MCTTRRRGTLRTRQKSPSERYYGALGIDGEAAIKQIQSLKLNVKVHRTRDITVAIIRAGHLSVQDDDTIKTDWKINHRFRKKFKSFGDLLS
jgi:hypothetical protein